MITFVILNAKRTVTANLNYKFDLNSKQCKNTVLYKVAYSKFKTIQFEM